MSAEILLTLAILGIAVVMFIGEWVRPDLVALFAAVALNLSGVIGVEAVLAGFGSPAVITIASLLVIGEGMVRNGAVKAIADRLDRLVGHGRQRLMLLSTLVPGVLSGFINIVAAVSLFIPGVKRLARLNRRPASRLLLPMACAGMAGANLTLIGASHNLVVNDRIRASGMPGFGFFEFGAVGAVLLLVVAVYSMVFGERLLPRRERDRDRREDERPDLIDRYKLRERLWQLWLAPDSAGVGRSLRDLDIETGYGMTVFALWRDDLPYPVEDLSLQLKGRDLLLVGGRRERVEALVEDNPGLVLLDEPEAGHSELPLEDAELIEVAVDPHGRALHKTLGELKLRERTGLTGVALWRDQHPIRTDVIDLPLQAGDALLLFGPRQCTRRFDPAPDFLWLNRPPADRHRPRLRRPALASAVIFMAIIISAALGWADIAVLTLLGAAIMVLAGLLSARQAYNAIDWRTLVLIAAMLPMGTALQASGASGYLAELLVALLSGAGPLAVMLGLAAMAMLFTQPLHNAVVAVVMTPVALDSAAMLGTNPRAYAVAVLVGASASFLLPTGHPAPLLVRRPGGYGIADYVRFGAGLNVLTLIVIGLMVPWLWPL